MTHPARRRLGPRGILTAVLLVLALGLGLAACAATDGGTRMPAGIPTVATASGSDAYTEENGYIAVGDSVSPFDEHVPTIAKLDPELRAAVQAAATAAIADGFEFVVTSGWRSAAYQQALLDDATVTYGSLEEARKWVNTPELSAHVTGGAVDIGFTDANSWLSQHGADYGLCQIYGNEMWHFELAVEPGGTCPVQKDDAAG
ncbi:M15 family metallopeptidase [Conyzicola nivalis]|uniref:D-alanyl-D-alanine carboxypeptidase n=1 Tax=Conyzicola nivalis TaxID=1477021 RepID=A0A916SMG7_9MICO|nr:M15 family metallopeptidase [Conyzicola nivalis]GGB07803.1 D-alanyl-D-alanine carboxypeptidase [Conyzicola nivalis]